MLNLIQAQDADICRQLRECIGATPHPGVCVVQLRDDYAKSKRVQMVWLDPPASNHYATMVVALDDMRIAGEPTVHIIVQTKCTKSPGRTSGNRPMSMGHLVGPWADFGSEVAPSRPPLAEGPALTVFTSAEARGNSEKSKKRARRKHVRNIEYSLKSRGLDEIPADLSEELEAYVEFNTTVYASLTCPDDTAMFFHCGDASSEAELAEAMAEMKATR